MENYENVGWGIGWAHEGKADEYGGRESESQDLAVIQIVYAGVIINGLLDLGSKQFRRKRFRMFKDFPK
jgi:hypothetical protein